MLRRGGQPSSSSLNPQDPATPTSTTSPSLHVFPRSTSPGIATFFSKPSKWFARTPAHGRQAPTGAEPRASTSSTGRKPKISHPTDPRPILPSLKSDPYITATRSVLDLSLQRTDTSFDASPSFSNPGSPLSPSGSTGLGDLRNISRKAWSRSADDLGKFSASEDPAFHAKVEQYRNRSASNSSSLAPSLQSQHPFPTTNITPLSSSPPQSVLASSPVPSNSSPSLSPGGPGHVHSRSQSFTPRMPSKLTAPKLAFGPSSPSRKGSASSEREIDALNQREKDRHGPSVQGRGAFPFHFGPGASSKVNLASQPSSSHNQKDPSSPLLAPPAIIEPEQEAESSDRSKRMSQIIHHSGFVNYHADFSLADCHNGSLNLSKGWKPYKLVLKGTKLYFYKPPSDKIAAVKELFPTSLVPALEEALDQEELEAPVVKEKEEVRDTRKKRAFWGRRTHPELVFEGKVVTSGTMEALVHEAVFGTVTMSQSPGGETHADTTTTRNNASWHSFASSVLLCLPALAGRSKVETELIRCCSYLVSGAPDDTKDALRARVAWIAGEYLRYHGTPVNRENWEEYRKDTIPDFPADAAFVGEVTSLPSSSSLQGLYVPSPRPEDAQWGTFSPSLGVFSPRLGQTDKMVSLLDALNLREPASMTGPSNSHSERENTPGPSATGPVWAALEREGLTRENLLRLDPHLVALSLSVYHRRALELAPVNLTFAQCVHNNDDLNPEKAASEANTSSFHAFFGSDDNLHWLTKLILNQILGADRSSRVYPAPAPTLSGGRSSEDRAGQTSRTHSRSEVISTWAKIAEVCRMSGDESSWQAIKAALCSRPVARLEKAWKRVDAQAQAAVESWVYPDSDGNVATVKEPKTTPWGGDAREKIKASLSKASIPDREDEWLIAPLQRVRGDFEDLRNTFSLCFRRSELTDTSDVDAKKLVEMWQEYVLDGSTAAKFSRVDQFMSLSLAAEPRRKGLFEPHFWTKTPPSAMPTSHPLVPLLLVEPLPTVTFIDRSQLLRNRVDSGPTSLVIEDNQFAMLMRSDHRLGRRDSDRIANKGLNNVSGRDLGGTVIPVFDGELLLVVQPWNPDSRAPSRSSSRARSRPPSSADPGSPEKPVSRAPSIRVKPGASQGLDRKPSVARRSSLPAISQRPNHVVTEPSSERPLRVVVKAGTLDRLVDVLVHGLLGVSVSVADDNGEMPLNQRRTRELRVDRAEFVDVWWNAFRSFMTPLVFFELLCKRYNAAHPKPEYESTHCIRTVETRIAVLDTLREWLEIGGGAQDCLDDPQLFAAAQAFLDRNDLCPSDSSMEDQGARQILEILSTDLRSLRQSFYAQTQKPKARTVVSGEISTKQSRYDYGREAPDVDSISPEELVGNLDAMATAVCSNVTEEDLFVTADLFEVQMADRVAWFLPPQFTQSSEEVDIHTIYSHVLNCEPSPLIAELTHDTIYRLLPPSIRSCIRAFTILHKWLVSKLVAPKVGSRVRQARMNLYLQALELCRLRNSDATSSRNPADCPCVRSFVESTVVSAILSVESRLHHSSWYNVAAARGTGCESISALLSKPQVRSVENKESLTVDMGWVLERMLEVMSVSDTLSSADNESQTLVNYEKRRYLRSIIVNTVSESGPRRNRKRREVDRRDFDRLNNIEKEVNHVDFDYRAIKEEAYRESMQANNGLAGPRKGHRPFHKHVVAQQEKNKRDKYLRDRLSREKKLEQQRMDRREDYLNKAMHVRRPVATGQKQHRNKKSMSTAFFQFMRPISSAFLSETPAGVGVKRTAEELDFIPGNKPSFTLSAADAGVAPFINNERSYLFRLDTEDGGHYLLQAINKQALKKWIDTIGRVSKTAAQRRLTYLGPPQSELSDHMASGSTLHSRDPRAVFGVDLEVLVHRDKSNDDKKPVAVPVFLERCLSEIENRGLTESGIYRVAGASSDIQMLKSAINQGEWPVTPLTDIYAVCDLVKHWLRDLPRPILPSSSYLEILAAAKLDDLDSKLVRLRDIVQALPSANFEVLKRVAEHLDRVTDYEDQNHMTAKNLAIVFSPSLLRAPDGNFMAFMSNLGHLHEFVKVLIGHFHVIFDEDQEVELDPDDDEFDEPILEEDEEDLAPSPSPSPSPEPDTGSGDSPDVHDTPLQGLS